MKPRKKYVTRRPGRVSPKTCTCERCGAILLSITLFYIHILEKH